MIEIMNSIFTSKDKLINKLIGIGFTIDDAHTFMPYLAQIASDFLYKTSIDKIRSLDMQKMDELLDKNIHIYNFERSTGINIKTGKEAVFVTLPLLIAINTITSENHTSNTTKNNSLEINNAFIGIENTVPNCNIC